MLQRTTITTRSQLMRSLRLAQTLTTTQIAHGTNVVAISHLAVSKVVLPALLLHVLMVLLLLLILLQQLNFKDGLLRGQIAVIHMIKMPILRAHLEPITSQIST